MTLTLVNPNGRPSFAQALRREREKMGKSMHDVATHVGVRREVAEEWEAGRSPTRFQFKRMVHMMRALRHYPPMTFADDPTILGVQAAPADVAEPAPLPANEPKPTNFGEALRLERQAEGLSQRELGELVGVANNAVTYWEQNRGISQEMVDRLFELFPRLKSAPPPSVGCSSRPGRQPAHKAPLTATLGALTGFVTTPTKVAAAPVPPPPVFKHPPIPAAGAEPQKLVPFRRNVSADLEEEFEEEVEEVPFVAKPVAEQPGRLRSLETIAAELKAQIAQREALDKRITALRQEMREQMKRFEELMT